MIKKKIEIDITEFPQEFQAYVRGSEVYDSSCGSEAKVYYFDSGYYLKVDAKGKLQREAQLTRKFFDLGLGAEFIAYFSQDRDYMLTKAVEGNDALHYLQDPEKLCRELAAAMKMLHSKSAEGMPISPQMENYLRIAQSDYKEGEFVDYVIMDKYKVHSRQEAWKIMQANGHKLKIDTLIHGDFCLPNVMLKEGRFYKLIDLGLAGAGDRHVDIYWALWSLQHNLKTEEYTGYFLDLYGRENFDEDMLWVVAAFESFGE